MERQRSLDSHRHMLRLQYTINGVVSVLVLIGVCGLFMLPKFTNILYYV
jgi:hypothetical protein